MVNRVACFLTCGYTEAGEMQSFLRKMNSSLEFKQYLPNKTIKKRGEQRMVSSLVNGLTGQALLEKVYEILRKYSAEISQCVAILIEDDLDGRFLRGNDGQIDAYREEICQRVCALTREDMPVFLLYASPEIESWFIADWINGFGYAYCHREYEFDIPKPVRQYFVHHLREYVMNYVLQQYKNDIENYGLFDGTYVKLSDELIKAIEKDVKSYIVQQAYVNSQYAEQIASSRELYYSKKYHGGIMLREILPCKISEKIYMRHFRRAYDEIHNFQP